MAHPPDVTSSRPRGVIIFLVVWVLLQLPRLIAIPLIGDVSQGTDDSAWMYPAILDVVVAVAAIPVAWLLWRRTGLLTYVAAVVFFCVSIIDHGDAVTAALLAPTPQVFGGPDATMPTWIAPGIQAAIDVVALWVLSRPVTRRWYGVS